MAKDAVAIIPARGGSKRIPRKNIKDFFGKPLIAYSIEAALKSNIFQRVIVTTDDEEIAAIAGKYGAEIPFIRPKELSTDFTGMADVVNHAKPASTLVSSSRGLGVTTGKIKIINNERSFSLQWDPSECAVMPMLQRTLINDEALSRVLFSMKETDDTVKFPSNIGKFSLTIDAS